MYIVTKTQSFVKLFALISITGLVMYAILAFFTFHTAYTIANYEPYHSNDLLKTQLKIVGRDIELKYILVWTIPELYVDSFGEGQKPFTEYNCSYSNCFVTTKRHLFNGDHKNFDAVVLDVGVVRQMRNVTLLPRNLEQKFVFYGMRSAAETPVCLVTADRFFNWTWSYKLSADIVTSFIEVTDLNGNFIAPKYNVQWLKNMTELQEKDMEKLQTKKKAVAWIMDTCKEKQNRMMFVKALQAALKEHSLGVDVFTQGCGKKSCPNDDCLKLIKQDYYYYLAYERSYTEDYVTEEVLKAYDNYAVPIVKGGADYKLFLPEGSYLNAQSGSVKRLASIIEYSIRNPEVYYNFHRWRNHYIIRKVDARRGLCDLCQSLNTPSKVDHYSTYDSFRSWWYNGPLGERCFPKGAETMREIVSYLNSTKKRQRSF